MPRPKAGAADAAPNGPVGGAAPVPGKTPPAMVIESAAAGTGVGKAACAPDAVAAGAGVAAAAGVRLGMLIGAGAGVRLGGAGRFGTRSQREEATGGENALSLPVSG